MISKHDPRRFRRGSFIDFAARSGGKIITQRGAVGAALFITQNSASIARAVAMLVFIFSGAHEPSSDEKQEHSRVTAPE